DGHVKMGAGPVHEWAEGGHQDATLCCRGGNGCSGSATSVDHHDVGLDGIRIDGSSQVTRHCLGEDSCCCMIIGEALHMVIKCVQAGSGEHSGLTPAPAEPLSHNSG